MAEVTSSPTAVSYRDEGFLNAGISASATTITVAAIYKYPSGVKTKQGINATGGFAEISLGSITEVISFGSSSVDGTTKITTWTDVRRGLSQTATSATFTAGTGRSWPKGARVRVIDYSAYLNNTAFTDKANTFTTHQTISSTNELRFADSATAVWDDGTDLNFKSSAQATRTLTQLASLSGSNDKFKVSSNDTTENYAASKLTGGDGITVTETSDGSNETLDFDVELASDPGLEFSSGALRAKIKASGGVTRDSNGLSVDTSIAALQALGKLFGQGADGTPDWSAGASLNPANEFHYAATTLPVSQTLTVSAVNDPLVIKTVGDVTINGTIDLNSQGPAGVAGVSSADTTGNAGTAGNSLISGYTTGGGSGGGFETGTARGGGGGGGSSGVATGTSGTTDNGAAGGAGGVMITAQRLAFLSTLMRGVVCGGGGGSGGRSNTGTSGAGGAGGGAMVWMIGGNLTLGASSIIRANGAAGSNATGGGDGGGGGGGMVVIIVGGSITNSGATLTASGGAGATGGTSGEGGAGADGKVVIYSLSAGTLITS